ncbi:SRPBCC family protein [Pseudoduganella umbonata]|uniref:Putative membrane protein n=1 Tax=Pseudoduganella umbonata TaxID=864828 RepID=A0A4P8HLL9_9BURK|nr:SRPBCC family protein [Pseudoduganella umbonata]MBB3219785.1 putative membrane protein [Pseudoduganella umbonata]QCP09826.1 SRPBCC family protein [Pseudoduganella umbonata]
MKRLLALAAVAAGGAYLAKYLKGKGAGQSGSTARETITVDVPVRTAYDQWTQFEEFPTFMDSVHEVRQLDDKRLHWKADVLGKPIEWDAEIVEQIPDQRIAWRSTTGTPNSGVVRFEPQGDTRTRIVLELSYTPTDAVEAAGDVIGAVGIEARGNLERFKKLIESRGKESGAWRGTIQGGPEGPRVTH